MMTRATATTPPTTAPAIAPALALELELELAETEVAVAAQYAIGHDVQSRGTVAWQTSPLAHEGHLGEPS